MTPKELRELANSLFTFALEYQIRWPNDQWVKNFSGILNQLGKQALIERARRMPPKQEKRR